MGRSVMGLTGIRGVSGSKADEATDNLPYFVLLLSQPKCNILKYATMIYYKIWNVYMQKFKKYFVSRSLCDGKRQD
jgi:hypothetical protein